jgi:hypothetical protein
LRLANLAHGAEDGLEIGELLLDTRILPRGIGGRPRRNAHAFNSRLQLNYSARRRHLRQELPDLFREKRHHRMQKTH